MGILLAILALSFLIIIHELGHFLVAKAFKVKVNEFSLFMGPKLLSFQKGETMYSLRLIPLGGYVKMEGEEAASDDDRAFNKKPVAVRAAIIAAGPAMNILIAIVLAFILISQAGFFTTEVKSIKPGSEADNAGIQVGDKLLKYNGKTIYQVNDLDIFAYTLTNESVNLEYERNGEKATVTVNPNRYAGYMLGFTPLEQTEEGKNSNVVASLTSNSPAKEAGLKEGDRITKLNGIEINTRKDVSSVLDEIKSNKVIITVIRDGKELNLKEITPMARKISEFSAIGISDLVHKDGSFTDILSESVKYNISISRSIYYSLGWLFTGKVPASELSGPIGITTTIKDVVDEGTSAMESFMKLLSITTMISINLGLVNLIPFPALDGSKLILLLVEGIRKKPLNPEKEAMISLEGFVFLIALLIYASFNDILRIF